MALYIGSQAVSTMNVGGSNNPQAYVGYTQFFPPSTVAMAPPAPADSSTEGE